MHRLHTLVMLLLADQLITWTSGLAIAKNVIQTPTDLLEEGSRRSLLQTSSTPGICPETEYYCGPGDAFEQEVHVALNQPKNCSFDTGNSRSPTTHTPKKAPTPSISSASFSKYNSCRCPAVVLWRLCHHRQCLSVAQPVQCLMPSGMY